MELQDDQAAGELLHGRGWRKAFTVTEMVGRWASLVGAVEIGYEDFVDEYTNDLYSRNWLHEAWVLLPGHVLVTCPKPPMRLPRLTDEGGRGLFIVGRLAHRWGTRCSDRGKTVWVEQPPSKAPAQQR